MSIQQASCCTCTYTGAMYCTLLPMQTNTDCTDRLQCGINYIVHGSPAQVYQLAVDW